jgi:hypothetical protein
MEFKEQMDEKSLEIEKLEEKRYEYGERVTLARSKEWVQLIVFLRHT